MVGIVTVSEIVTAVYIVELIEAVSHVYGVIMQLHPVRCSSNANRCKPHLNGLMIPLEWKIHHNATQKKIE